ncbi:MAG: SRPBCC domain-containing protein [Acidimicrobiales bacterium]
MELTNDFRVALPVDRAWAVLTDLERIAPCMPGAQLQEVEGDEYRGIVKIKVGPITAQYKGKATFLEQDTANHKAVLRAEGRETRGQGNANATITATLTPDGDGTAVSVVTDLTVTGRVAQFGRGVLADVSAKLLGQFVDCLETTVLADEPAAESAVETPEPVEAVDIELQDAMDVTEPEPVEAEPPTAEPDPEPEPDSGPLVAPTPSPTPSASEPEPPALRRIDSPEAKPVDLLDAAGSPVLRRVGPVVAVVALVWLLKKLFGRQR